METEKTSTASMLAFLGKPASYPHHPAQVEIRQTHASVLAIAPPYVYKVKKHVNLGFLDFTRLGARKENCERELRLNSRLCADLYIGVVPIGLHQGQLAFGPTGRIVDYALQMHQLPDGYFLDQLLASHQVSPLTLEAVLAILKSFYEQHPPSPSVLVYGDSALIRKTIRENLAPLQQQVGGELEPAALRAVGQYFQHFLAANRELFARRVDQHWIRDCHGDLHLDHIHIRQGQVCIFDCIEFNDRFRYIDVASDMAFLAMDLDFHGRPDLSVYVTDRMAQLLGDVDMHRLRDFYKCYRACVRAKVEWIKSREPEVPAADRQHSRQTAQRYLSLALKYALFGSGPAVLIVCGRSGTGKSTLAQKLAHLLGWPCLSSDVTRKKARGLGLYQHPDPELRQRLYAWPVTDTVYESLLQQTLHQVNQQHPVVLDATFSQARYRTRFENALSRLHLPYFFLELQASDALIRQRLTKRKNSRQVVSDARPQDFDLLRQLYQPPCEVSPAHLLKINARPTPEAIVVQVLRQLSRLSHHPKPEVTGC